MMIPMTTRRMIFRILRRAADELAPAAGGRMRGSFPGQALVKLVTRRHSAGYTPHDSDASPSVGQEMGS